MPFASLHLNFSYVFCVVCSINVVMLQIALTLAVLISKIARIDYPREWYASLHLLCTTYWKEFSERLSMLLLSCLLSK